MRFSLSTLATIGLIICSAACSQKSSTPPPMVDSPKPQGDITLPQQSAPVKDTTITTTAEELGKQYEKLKKEKKETEMELKYYDKKLIVSGMVDNQYISGGDLGCLFLKCPNTQIKNGEDKPLQIYFYTRDAATIKELAILKEGDEVVVEGFGNVISLFGPGYRDFKFVKKR